MRRERPRPKGISQRILFPGGEGSWRKFLTLPNILKLFNPKLVGFSESWDDEQLNFAGPGMSVKNVPFLFKSVVKRLSQDPRVNLTYDWKVCERQFQDRNRFTRTGSFSW